MYCHPRDLSKLIASFEISLSTDDVSSEVSSARDDYETHSQLAEHHEAAEEDVLLVQRSAELESGQDFFGKENETSDEEQTAKKSEDRILTAAGVEEVDAPRQQNGERRETGIECQESQAKCVEKEREVEQLKRRNEELLEKLSELEEKDKHELETRDREIERLYSRNNELSAKERELEHLREKSVGGTKDENLKGVISDASNESELLDKIADLQQRHKELELTTGEAEEVKRINRELCKKVDEGELAKQELRRVEAEKQEMANKLEKLKGRNTEPHSSLSKEVESLRKENQDLAMKAKDVDAMKQNVIRLSAQLREMGSAQSSSAELQDLREKLEMVEFEKEQLHLKLEDIERESQGTQDNSKEVEELKLENITLVEKNKDVAHLRDAVSKLTAEVKENQSFRQKYKELRDVESVSERSQALNV